MAAEKCGVTGKIMFPTRQAALAFLGRYGWRAGSRRAHWCVFCESYHTTKGQRRSR